MSKKIKIFLILLSVTLIIGGAAFYFSRKSIFPVPSARPAQSTITHPPCLADDEIADYPIDPFYAEKLRYPKFPLVIYVKDKNTGEIKNNFRIENVSPVGHSIEMYKCNLYVIRVFNFDEKRGVPLPNYRTELWRFHYDGSGEKLIDLFRGEGVADNYRQNFRVDSAENYLVLERSYLGNSNHALVIKNLIIKEDAFVLPLRDLISKDSPKVADHIEFNEWTKNGRYFWFRVSSGADVLAFSRIEADTWKYEIFEAPKGTMGGDALNPELGFVTYDTGIPWTGIDVFTQELNQEFQEQGKINSFYVYNLFTKEQVLVATTTDGAWSFRPNWISDTELEYNAPPSGEKKIYKISD